MGGWESQSYSDSGDEKKNPQSPCQESHSYPICGLSKHALFVIYRLVGLEMRNMERTDVNIIINFTFQEENYLQKYRVVYYLM
jgi:hypothetical protein